MFIFFFFPSLQEANVVSVERIDEYASLESEAALVVPDYRPPPDWPQKGCIELKSYSTKYRSNLNFVLKVSS
jgi:hypothetical protein